MDNKWSEPSFYAVLPAYVRYDKELSSTAKILYSEITALCNQKGFCWANNQYFENLYSISERQVQNILKLLKEKKYISIELVDNQKRKIFISDNPEKNFGVGMKKITGFPEKNFIHNTITNNTEDNIKNKKSDFFEYDWLNTKEK